MLEPYTYLTLEPAMNVISPVSLSDRYYLCITLECVVTSGYYGPGNHISLLPKWEVPKLHKSIDVACWGHGPTYCTKCVVSYGKCATDNLSACNGCKFCYYAIFAPGWYHIVRMYIRTPCNTYLRFNGCTITIRYLYILRTLQ